MIPHVHQFELHPCLYQPDVLELCKKHHIQVQAYSSLGEGKLINGELNVPSLKLVSKRVQQPCALVLLRWAVQHGWIIIPKSKTTARIKQNAGVFSFELSKEVRRNACIYEKQYILKGLYRIWMHWTIFIRQNLIVSAGILLIFIKLLFKYILFLLFRMSWTFYCSK